MKIKLVKRLNWVYWS